MSAENPQRPARLPQPPRASAKLWLYRALAAIAFPAALLLGLEGALRMAGFGQSVRFLIPDAKPGYFRTNPAFVSSFLPSNFKLTPLNFRVSRVKGPNTLRIVVLGESAAQGVPEPAFGFAAQLRAQLRARYPDKRIEVINTGIVAINSHVVYQVAREMAGYSPDLFVVYMGNNEVVGPYGPGCAYLSEMPPLWIIRLSVFVRSTRTGQLMTAILGRLTVRDRHPAEWGGMSMFVNNAVSGDDPRLEAVYRNFEANLADIVRVAADSRGKDPPLHGRLEPQGLRPLRFPPQGGAHGIGADGVGAGIQQGADRVASWLGGPGAPRPGQGPPYRLAIRRYGVHARLPRPPSRRHRGRQAAAY